MKDRFWLTLLATAAASCSVEVESDSGDEVAEVQEALLPSPWLSADVGAVAATGSASHSGSTFTVKGSGADIWNAADEFRFVYRSWSGNGQITARISSLQNTNAWAKAGVMFRESLSAGSKHALMAVSATSGLAFQRRTSSGGSSASTGASGGVPRWLRLQRSGSTITGQSSSDGSTWTTVGSATVSMTSSLYVGLAVTSHADGTLTTASVANVSVGSLPSSGTSGIAGVVGESTFNSWFSSRNSFYTYAGLTSINDVYADFVNSSDATIRKREAAAFLANISWESDWLKAIKEYNTANYCNYCGSCGCPAGRCNYYGRGPIQLSWDCNYKAAGQSIGKDLLNNPDLVSSNASVAWQTAGWFWNTQPGPGGYGSHAHAAMLASSGSGGFGATIAHINGSQECPSLGGSNTSARDARIARYKSFCDQLGVSYGNNLGC